MKIMATFLILTTFFYEYGVFKKNRAISAKRTLF